LQKEWVAYQTAIHIPMLDGWAVSPPEISTQKRVLKTQPRL
jgi:hypothetical protein